MATRPGPTSACCPSSPSPSRPASHGAAGARHRGRCGPDQQKFGRLASRRRRGGRAGGRARACRAQPHCEVGERRSEQGMAGEGSHSNGSRRQSSELLRLAGFGANEAVNHVLKHTLRRPRPPTCAALGACHSFGFPSSHAQAAWFYVALCLLVRVSCRCRPDLVTPSLVQCPAAMHLTHVDCSLHLDEFPRWAKAERPGKRQLYRVTVHPRHKAPKRVPFGRARDVRRAVAAHACSKVRT